MKRKSIGLSTIRNIEKAITGSGLKEPSPSEIKNKSVARKSIVAIKPIKKGGAKLDESNLQGLCHKCHNRKTYYENHPNAKIQE